MKMPHLELSWNLHLRFDFQMEGCTCLGGVGEREMTRGHLLVPSMVEFHVT